MAEMTIHKCERAFYFAVNCAFLGKDGEQICFNDDGMIERDSGEAIDLLERVIDDAREILGFTLAETNEGNETVVDDDGLDRHGEKLETVVDLATLPAIRFLANGIYEHVDFDSADYPDKIYNCLRPVVNDNGTLKIVDCWLVDSYGRIHPGFNCAAIPKPVSAIGKMVAIVEDSE